VSYPHGCPPPRVGYTFRAQLVQNFLNITRPDGMRRGENWVQQVLAQMGTGQQLRSSNRRQNWIKADCRRYGAARNGSNSAETINMRVQAALWQPRPTSAGCGQASSLLQTPSEAFIGNL